MRIWRVHFWEQRNTFELSKHHRIMEFISKKLFQVGLKQNRLSIVSNLLVAMIYFHHNALAVVNSLTIREEDGVATANYPIQIARPFVQGEIMNFPQAEVNGVPVFTQALPRELEQGVYFLKMNAGDLSITKPMVVQ